MGKISIIYLDKQGNTKEKSNIKIVNNSIVDTTQLLKKQDTNIKYIISVLH